MLGSFMPAWAGSYRLAEPCPCITHGCRAHLVGPVASCRFHQCHAVLPSALLLPPCPAVSQKKLAVLREPFLRHDAHATPLASTVAATGAGQVAVSSAVREHAGRVVVDEYVAAADGSYKLSTTSTDLLRYLRQQGLAVSLVPDVARAATFNSVRAAGGQRSSNKSSTSCWCALSSMLGACTCAHCPHQKLFHGVNGAQSRLLTAPRSCGSHCTDCTPAPHHSMPT
jgi:hypothetical protein